MKARKTIFGAILCVLAGLALSPGAQAVVPAPDGGYPGGNTAEGQNALLSLNVNTGINNTAVGWFSLRSNVGGQYNTAVGSGTLFNNTASRNTAVGGAAMFSNTGGSFNTAVGMLSLFTNSTGSFNTAIGDGALFTNATGNGNTANGFSALSNNTTGDGNTANGIRALLSNTTGTQNTAVGGGAGANITGSGNVCIGHGVLGAAGTNNTTWIRNVHNSVASARAVYVNSDNKIGTLASSRRYKDEIRPMAKASEAILWLRPVSFRYKKEVDPTGSLSFGLIAEEAAQVDPDLVTTDRNGKPETVRYEAVNAMLLNEFLKARRQIDAQQKQIDALTAGLQTVSAQLEASKPTPQVVLNKP